MSRRKSKSDRELVADLTDRVKLFCDSMIFLDYEIQYKSLPLRIFYQNIGEKLTILKVMLKVLSNWSKNGI